MDGGQSRAAWRCSGLLCCVLYCASSVIVVSVINFIYRGDTLPQIQHQIAMVAGNNAAEAIVATIRGIQAQGGSTIATVISIVTLLVGATGVFSALQDSMNTIWEVTPKPGRLWSESFEHDFSHSRS